MAPGPIHHPKAGEAEVARQLLVQPRLAEGEQVRVVADLARAAVLDHVQLDRRLEVASEMEELHRKGRAAVRPERVIGLELDLLIGIVIDGLEDLGVADQRRPVGLRGKVLGFALQPVEVERARGAEVDRLAARGRRPERAESGEDPAPIMRSRRRTIPNSWDGDG